MKTLADLSLKSGSIASNGLTVKIFKRFVYRAFGYAGRM